MNRLILILSAFIFTSNTLTGQAGHLDTSFHETGMFIYDGGNNANEICYNSALQPDGKLLLCGYGKVGSSSDFLIQRYLPDGQPDPDFGQNGVLIADYNGQNQTPYAIFLQPDGRILIAGETSTSPGQLDIAVHRIWPDGSPDKSFGDNGWVVTDLGTDYEIGLTIDIQSDGKILVAGRMADLSASNFALLRYHPDGQLDSLFGDQGVVETNFREEDAANDMCIQPDGKIVLAGFASVSASGDFALARYLPDGTLDKLFGDGGKVLTDLSGNGRSDFIVGVELLPDGRLIAAGTANAISLPSSSSAGLAMYLPNGQLDTSFGTEGIQIHELGFRHDWSDVALVPDGRLLVCGKSNVEQSENRWILARLKANGEMDSTFAQIGYVTLPMNGLIASARRVWLQPDSRIVLTGISGSSPDFDFAAARYLSELILPSTTVEVTCRGGADGSLSITVTGGAPPYMYSLDGGPFQDISEFHNLQAGAHYVTVRDANGYTGVSGYIHVNEPAPATYQLLVEGQSLTIEVTQGGSEPLQYSIDGGLTYQADPFFPDLLPGTYMVVVMDNMGCILLSEEVTIMITGTSEPGRRGHLQVLPNPSQGFFRLQLDQPLLDNSSIRIFQLGGISIPFTQRPASEGSAFDIILNDRTPGVYGVVVESGSNRYFGKLIIL